MLLLAKALLFLISFKSLELLKFPIFFVHLGKINSSQGSQQGTRYRLHIF